jgi:NADH-quinone oxidoreductase subunit N
MLVGVIAGPGAGDAPFTRNGLAAVLFYLGCYGIMTIGGFTVIASLEKHGEEADDIDDLRGLALTRPVLGWTMVLSVMGLLGLPPLLGFFGKVPLFTSAIGAGEIPLVIVLGINSAIAAYYYLRLAYVCFIEAPETLPSVTQPTLSPSAGSRHVAGVASMVGVLGLTFLAGPIANLAKQGAEYTPVKNFKTPAASAGAAVSKPVGAAMLPQRVD